jgi:hypothetical protein
VPGWIQRLLRVGERTSGVPPSANGASSFHLRWEITGRFRSAEVTLEVVEPPQVAALHFWALQADFAERSGRHRGGAHLGLQWFPPHPASTAVNWGGYDDTGRELAGTDSTLPSATGNPNTRDLPWRPGTAYRLRIERAGGSSTEAAWSGSVTELGPDRRTPVGPVTEVRRLLVPGGVEITGCAVWSEVFARCDDPTVVVRWSDPEVVGVDGRRATPTAVTTSYQTHQDGGCANTDSSVDGVGLVQRTAVRRVSPPGTRLGVPS